MVSKYLFEEMCLIGDNRFNISECTLQKYIRKIIEFRIGIQFLCLLSGKFHHVNFFISNLIFAEQERIIFNIFDFQSGNFVV
jgi:hypothetical protein